MENDRTDEKDLRLLACPYCHGLNLTKRMLFAGPLPFVDNDDGSYKCRSCGMVAVPIEFSSLEEYQRFINEEKEEQESMRVLPLVPLDFEQRRKDKRRTIKVRSLSWQEGQLRKGPDDVDLATYWRALTETYGTKEGVLLDLGGIGHNRPDMQGLQEAMKRRRDVWVDPGVGDEEDVLDGFSMGIERMLALSLGVPELSVLGKIISISDQVVPCLCYDGKVRWGRRRGTPGELKETLRTLKDMGYHTVAVLDLRRLGSAGPDLRFLEEVLILWPKAILGGGLHQEDLPKLIEMGAGGALLDPYGPELVAILEKGVPEKRQRTEH